MHPFQFVFKLLLDEDIQYLTQDEIALFVVTEAINDNSKCYSIVKNRIINYRNFGEQIIDKQNFVEQYRGRNGIVQTFEKTISRLNDVANTVINWIEYTQLALRDSEKKLTVVTEKEDEIEYYINRYTKFINRHTEHEYYQRKFGLDPEHQKIQEI